MHVTMYPSREPADDVPFSQLTSIRSEAEEEAEAEFLLHIKYVLCSLDDDEDELDEEDKLDLSGDVPV